jgi:type IV pilus assembly protein PilM
MVDWKKEIDLKALLQLPKRGGSTPQAPAVRRVPRDEAKLGEVVGLEIGASKVAAAYVVNNGDSELRQLVRQPLAPGLVAGGEVRDPAGLGDALDEFFARHELPRRGVRLGLGNTRVGVRVIEIPVIEDEVQLENAISFRAAEMLSVPIEDAALDYHVIGQGVDEDGQPTQRILLVVAYRDSIDRFLAATDQAGIKVAGIDLEAFALLRAVSPPTAGERSDAAVIVVCIGHERTTLAISDGKVCEFTRVLEWGGSALTAAVAHALKLQGQEAEQLKPSLSLDPGAPAPGDMPTARRDEALEAIRHELQKLVRELLSSLRFYQSQPDALPIGEVLLCGGTAHMSGLAAELERELGAPVRVADPLTRVRLGEKVDQPEATGSFTVAIGLGIEDQ